MAVIRPSGEVESLDVDDLAYSFDPRKWGAGVYKVVMQIREASGRTHIRRWSFEVQATSPEIEFDAPSGEVNVGECGLEIHGRISQGQVPCHCQTPVVATPRWTCEWSPAGGATACWLAASQASDQWTLTVPAGAAGGDYTFRLFATVGNDVVSDTVTVHVTDSVHAAPLLPRIVRNGNLVHCDFLPAACGEKDLHPWASWYLMDANRDELITVLSTPSLSGALSLAFNVPDVPTGLYTIRLVLSDAEDAFASTFVQSDAPFEVTHAPVGGSLHVTPKAGHATEDFMFWTGVWESEGPVYSTICVGDGDRCVPINSECVSSTCAVTVTMWQVGRHQSTARVWDNFGMQRTVIAFFDVLDADLAVAADQVLDNIGRFADPTTTAGSVALFARGGALRNMTSSLAGALACDLYGTVKRAAESSANPLAVLLGARDVLNGGVRCSTGAPEVLRSVASSLASSVRPMSAAGVKVGLTYAERMRRMKVSIGGLFDAIGSLAQSWARGLDPGVIATVGSKTLSIAVGRFTTSAPVRVGSATVVYSMREECQCGSTVHVATWVDTVTQDAMGCSHDDCDVFGGFLVSARLSSCGVFRAPSSVQIDFPVPAREGRSRVCLRHAFAQEWTSHGCREVRSERLTVTCECSEGLMFAVGFADSLLQVSLEEESVDGSPNLGSIWVLTALCALWSVA